MSSTELLGIRNLSVDYRLRKGSVVHAVRDLSVAVAVGETVAVVGESGSGKSTSAHAVVGLLPTSARVRAGQVVFQGEDLLGLPEKRARSLRGHRIGLIPQDPATSLNPVKRIGDQVAEVLLVHGLADRRNAHDRAIAALADAGLPDPEARAAQYPHELSGGMRQRVLIAIAVVAEPSLIVADEPTSALDVTLQRKILDHIASLSAASGCGVLLITHDLGVAAERADRIVVMSRGRIVEGGSAAGVLDAPQHSYTRQLIDAAPSLRRVSVVDEPAPPADESGVDHPQPYLVAENLHKSFRLPRSQSNAGHITAVDGVSFAIPRGQTFALVGESGSGKSTTARLVLRLADPDDGRIVIDGADVTTVRGKALRELRRTMQVVYQNPYVSLNPHFDIEQIVTDPLRAFGVGTRRERRSRAAELVDAVALPTSVLARKPAELSGGQRQRVAIARAIALRPALVVCDEPVSALDVSIQSQILDLLQDLQNELGLTYLFISHDLAVVELIAHHIGVMCRGELVESGTARAVLRSPQHPYTEELLASIPGRRALTALRN